MCSVRVCETSLSVLELLLDLGVVTTPASSPENGAALPKDETGTKPTEEDYSRRSHGICIDIIARLTTHPIDSLLTWYHFAFDSFHFTRVFQHVGCPHGCGDSRRDPSSDFIRSQGLLLLGQLHRLSSKYFRSFLRQMFTTRYSLVEVIDFLHALVGFCVDPGFVLSPISQFDKNIKLKNELNNLFEWIA